MIARGSCRPLLSITVVLILASCTPTLSSPPASLPTATRTPTDVLPATTPAPSPTPLPPTATPTSTVTPTPTTTPQPLRKEPGDPEEDALPLVLARHGVPSEVSLSFTTGAPCIGGGNFPTYALWIAYEEEDLALRYSGYLLYDHEAWFVCPTSRQGQSVQIRRRDAGTEVPLFILEEEVFDPGGEFSLYGTLSELAAMTPDEFHAAFVQTPP